MSLKLNGGDEDERPMRRPFWRTTLPRQMIVVTLLLVLVAMPLHAVAVSKEPMPRRLVPAVIPCVVAAFVVAIHRHNRRSEAERTAARAPRCRLCGEIQDPALNPQWARTPMAGRTCPECGCPTRGA